MKKIVSGFLFLFQLHLASYAQQPQPADFKSLQVTWEVSDNNTQGKSKSTIVFSNTGNKPFPNTGWTIFFNASGFKAQDTTQAIIRLVNGDLFALTPGPKFGALPAGGSKKVEVTGGAIRNVSGLPIGFYISADHTPTKGYPLNVVVKPLFNTEKNDFLVANRIYKQNQQIANIPAEKLVKIFPTPVKYTETADKFILDPTVVISADASFKNETEELTRYITQLTGKKSASQAKAKGKAIVLSKIAGLAPEEYKLTVTKNRITISASTSTGAFYGIQSLISLIPSSVKNTDKTISISGVDVSDSPRFGYRALQIDVARNFHSKAELLKILDLMALYKLNVFHFHFSEDEAWRLEIPSLPELTKVGSKRAATPDSKDHLYPSFGSGADTTSSGSGYYTKADFIEILKYANQRHIRVIPEIESPGHARAAIKAMDARYERLMKLGQPEEALKYLLRDPNDKSQYRSVQGWDDNVINIALPSTYNFMETVVDDIRKMYQEANAPLEMIHFGGDEVPAGVWEKSPAVNALLRPEGELKTPNDLWNYYFTKVNALLNKRNLSMYGWEESGLVKTFVNGKAVWEPNTELAKKKIQVDVWNNLPGSGAEDLAYRMANKGIKVVLTAVTNFYFDLAYNQSFDEPGYFWGGYVDIDKPFYFIPFDYLKNLKDNDGNPINPAIIKGREQLTEFGKSNIVGLQGAIWSENIRTPERLEYMLLPKMFGLAERAWSKEPEWAKENDAAKSERLYQTAWSEFINVVAKRELPRLDQYAGGFQYRVPTPGAVINQGQVEANVQFPEFSIHYTTDGSEPTLNSPVYSGPIKEKGTIKLKSFNLTGRGSHTVLVTNQ
ncbi:family 20 glycosylhydrolase [Xanthocytophaga agilis]|uniref:beta-N-acetylhexosaminidase n=1 Tax=Xanthocytophaga agilis TaxID=3048010 RepID=A0AAE3RA68_9BACT|nr:family 20 glycosylhydrolase [Xanthocytophaga agilis]MDJ1506045.1 family 20 glycosylhydrolase [Xanthocytophaga agilis]